MFPSQPPIMARSHRRFDGDFAISDRDFQSSDVLRRRPNLSQRSASSVYQPHSRFLQQIPNTAAASSGSSRMRHSVSLQEQRSSHLDTDHRHESRNGDAPRSRSRSRSKSTGRSGPRETRRHRTHPKVSEYYTLGRQKNPTNSYKASCREDSHPVAASTLIGNSAAADRRSKSKSRERRSSSRSRTELSSLSSNNTSTSATPKGSSKTSATSATSGRAANLSASSSVCSSPAAPIDLQSDIDFTTKRLQSSKEELVALQKELEKTQQLVSGKKYEIEDLQLQLESLQKRHRLFLKRKPQRGTFCDDQVAKHPREQITLLSSSDEEEVLQPTRKRSRAVVEDVDGDEDSATGGVQGCFRVSTLGCSGSSASPGSGRIKESPVTPKKDKEVVNNSSSSSSSSKPKSKSRTSDVSTTRLKEDVPDYFWGKSRECKMLQQPRVQTFPDLSARKLRCLALNPTKPDYFVTGSDDGGLTLWNYTRSTQKVSRVMGFESSSLRSESPCAEEAAWSPDGMRLAVGFRDPVSGSGEFCVVRMHQMKMKDNDNSAVTRSKSLNGTTSLVVKIPHDHIMRKTSQLHARGINCIQWLGTNDGSLQTRGLVTAGSDTVVHWEDNKDELTWRRVLHREHRSEVRALCVHSSGDQVFSGGLDGLVLQYDCRGLSTIPILQRRKPTIWKINSVLEHPHNPHLLLISCIDSNEQQLLLHDLRQGDNQNSMTLGWLKPPDARSMSQYIVPRWSPAGMHVSCGSTSGMVHIWDVRARGSKFPYLSPHQSLEMHKKQVLSATWHPRYNALFTISNDRTIGLASFK